MLLQKQKKWFLGDVQQECSQKVKSLLTLQCLLVHCDTNRLTDLIFSCDASPHGVAHRFSDGLEKCIVHASHSLRIAQKKYSQVDEEGLAIVFRVKKYHWYFFFFYAFENILWPWTSSAYFFIMLELLQPWLLDTSAMGTTSCRL